MIRYRVKSFKDLTVQELIDKLGYRWDMHLILLSTLTTVIGEEFNLTHEFYLLFSAMYPTTFLQYQDLLKKLFEEGFIEDIKQQVD